MAITQLKTFPIASKEAIGCGKDVPCSIGNTDGICVEYDSVCYGFGSVDGDCLVGPDKPCGGIWEADMCSGSLGSGPDNQGCGPGILGADVAIIMDNFDEWPV